jgi:hypothetical protein
MKLLFTLGFVCFTFNAFACEAEQVKVLADSPGTPAFATPQPGTLEDVISKSEHDAIAEPMEVGSVPADRGGTTFGLGEPTSQNPKDAEGTSLVAMGPISGAHSPTMPVEIAARAATATPDTLEPPMTKASDRAEQDAGSWTLPANSRPNLLDLRPAAAADIARPESSQRELPTPEPSPSATQELGLEVMASMERTLSTGPDVDPNPMAADPHAQPREPDAIFVPAID